MTIIAMTPTTVCPDGENNNKPPRKSFNITRKTSMMKLLDNSEKKAAETVGLRKAGSSSFLSIILKPFKSAKSPSKRTAQSPPLEQFEYTPQRVDSKIDEDFSLSSEFSAQSPARFSQALFIPTEPSLSSQTSSRRSSSDNPCLFVAFEQAIKSAELSAPSIPPELILKYNQENEARFDRDRKSRFLRKNSLSKTLDVGWTKKLFVLAPGLLLQYGTDGAYDREPERVLRLRSDSLTFATDIFDGKHYVLQISYSGETVPSTPDERRPSLLSRFGSKSRFDALVFLLVFEGAEEMQDWLVKIRKEISRLGGPSIEEHPQPPSSKAGTIVDEEGRLSRTPTNRASRISQDNVRKLSIGQDSEEMTPSVSGVSRDGVVLDDLRTSSYNSRASRERISQASLETSPERSSVRNSRRRSTASTSHSRSSTDLRIRSRPVSTAYGQEQSVSDRPPSPTLTQVSGYSISARRSLPPPIPIPVPSLPKRHASTVSYIAELPTTDIVNRRIRRTRKNSTPPSPDRLIPLLSTSLPNPPTPPPTSSNNVRRPRPVSLASAPTTPRRAMAEVMSGNRNRNLKRRSLGALSSSSLGPPMHPPPSAPLPKLPDGSTFPRLPVHLSPHSHIPQVPAFHHSPLALHAQSAADLKSVSKRQSLQTLS